MESVIFPKYLMDPENVSSALNFLDKECNAHTFEDLFRLFETKLGIDSGEGFPITGVTIDGLICRARKNDPSFPVANFISEIGVNPVSNTQGRANAQGYQIFYGANCKKTAAFEILQDEPIGAYEVTIGCWSSEAGLRLVNFVDGADPAFSKIPFAHSKPIEYLASWPEKPKESATLIIEYFKDRFKAKCYQGLYNITNILSGICFSLVDVDGIGYGATSDEFEGYNIAVRNFQKLKCVEVERWSVYKTAEGDFAGDKLKTGKVSDDGNISWDI